jgi:hypothetical protein
MHTIFRAIRHTVIALPLLLLAGCGVESDEVPTDDEGTSTGPVPEDVSAAEQGLGGQATHDGTTMSWSFAFVHGVALTANTECWASHPQRAVEVQAAVYGVDTKFWSGWSAINSQKAARTIKVTPGKRYQALCRSRYFWRSTNNWGPWWTIKTDDPPAH